MTKFQIAARVTEQEKKEIEKFCEERDIKVSQLIRWAIKEYIERSKKE